MKVTNGTKLRSVAPLILCFAFLWPFGGGNKDQVKMMAGSVTPAAQGKVQYQPGDNGNTDLDIQARYLAPPISLTPAENVYVLWIQPPGQAPQNHGRIEVNHHEQAELHTKTPYRRFRVFITAEENARTQAPTGPKVLSADVSRG